MSEAMIVGIIGASAGIVGGILGGLLSGIYQHFRDRHERPKLKIDFIDKDPAYQVEAGWMQEGKFLEWIIVRASVQNAGRKAATNCRVYLTKIQEVQATSKLIDTNFSDSMQLPWAGWKFEGRIVPRGITSFVDIVKVRKDEKAWDFSFEGIFASHKPLKAYQGTYRFSLVVTADNAEPAYCSVFVDYRHDWHNLRSWRSS